MKIVVWGLGFRGKTLIDYLGTKNVISIIESDSEKVGNNYNGIEIICVDDYKYQYSEYPIFITPEYQHKEEIIDTLEKKNIIYYFHSSEFPPTIRYNGKVELTEYINIMQNNRIVYLYGINAFSILLMLKLQDLNKKVMLVADINRLEKNQSFIKEKFTENVIDIKRIDSIHEKIYVTTHEYVDDLDTIFKEKEYIDLFRYAEKMEVYHNRELEKIHNIYKNRRCFIVATGPSLTQEDLSILKNNNEFCFTVNGMCKIETEWKPSAYVVSDGKFFSDNKEKIRQYDCSMKFLPDDDPDFWLNKKNGEYYIHRSSLDAYDIFEFSEDISRMVSTQGTVTVGCIEIAVYMGFKEIYLLGTDCNYQMGSTRNHFGGDLKPDNIDHSVLAMLNGYKMCKEYADSHNIKIYNATRGGMLEVFERVDFDSLFD